MSENQNPIQPHELSRFDDAYEKTNAGYDDRPVKDGKYNVTTCQCKLRRTKKNIPMLCVAFEISGGPHDGQWLWKNYVMDPSRLTKNGQTAFLVSIKIVQKKLD